MSEARIPRILELAPNFEARSTQGTIRLSDYTTQGKWVMLFSHPADFTPVCSTEFIEFARRSADWVRLNVQPIGVSIDSLHSHIAWVLDLERLSGVNIDFPIIADLDQRVSQAYGLVHEAVSDTSTVRAVFFIDPKGLIRSLVYYPVQLGRNVDEIIRMFEALQVADANGVSCPANWKPGEAVVLPSPATQAEAAKRAAGTDGGETRSWYLATRMLPLKS